VTIVVTLAFSSSAQRALSLAHERAQELTEATRQAQQAAQSAQEAREHEEKAALQLRQAVQEYTAFLEQVTAGDYGARLTLDETTQGSELAALGQRLNATVESLVKALQDLQAVQQRYARQAWEGFTQSRGARVGFRSRGEAVEPSGEAWLPPMTPAVRGREAVAEERALALPILSRGVVIGAIGARRDPGNWSDDEVALITAITDQLAQTLEGLRLLDETQRLAAREQTINTVTARIRGVPTVNAILQRTVQELGRTFGASRASIRVEMSEPAGKA
jgi:GAF domain-containing protein